MHWHFSVWNKHQAAAVFLFGICQFIELMIISRLDTNLAGHDPALRTPFLEPDTTKKYHNLVRLINVAWPCN